VKTKNPLTTVAVVVAFAMASTMISFTAIITIEDQQAYAQVTGGSNTANCNLTGSTTGGSSPITQTCSQSQGMCLLGQQSSGDATGSISGSECS
jgi:hypothetical protein